MSDTTTIDQPFDPAALGFIKERDGEYSRWYWIGPDNRRWRLFQLLDGMCTIKTRGMDAFYYGAWPESHAFAVTLFRHLGLEIA